MREFAKNYFKGLINDIKSAKVSDQGGRSIDIFEGIELVSHEIISNNQNGKKLMFIGNGASAAIASHMSTDYWKNGGKIKVRSHNFLKT